MQSNFTAPLVFGLLILYKTKPTGIIRGPGAPVFSEYIFFIHLAGFVWQKHAFRRRRSAESRSGNVRCPIYYPPGFRSCLVRVEARLLLSDDSEEKFVWIGCDSTPALSFICAVLVAVCARGKRPRTWWISPQSAKTYAPGWTSCRESPAPKGRGRKRDRFSGPAQRYRRVSYGIFAAAMQW